MVCSTFTVRLFHSLLSADFYRRFQPVPKLNFCFFAHEIDQISLAKAGGLGGWLEIFGYWPACRKKRRWRKPRRRRCSKIKHDGGFVMGTVCPKTPVSIRFRVAVRNFSSTRRLPAHPRYARRRPKRKSGSFGTGATYLAVVGRRGHGPQRLRWVPRQQVRQAVLPQPRLRSVPDKCRK